MAGHHGTVPHRVEHGTLALADALFWWMSGDIPACAAAAAATVSTQRFIVLGEGVITDDRSVDMRPADHSSAGTSLVALGLSADCWTSCPVDTWPKRWLKTLPSGAAARDGSVFASIKSVPPAFLQSWVQQAVTDDVEAGRLLQFARQHTDLGIRLQVRAGPFMRNLEEWLSTCACPCKG